MKKITLTYQLWVCCEREIEVPNDYVIPRDKIGYDLFKDLRDKYPDHDIWDTIPDSDGDGDIDIYDHLDYVYTHGLDIPIESSLYKPNFDIDE